MNTIEATLPFAFLGFESTGLMLGLLFTEGLVLWFATKSFAGFTPPYPMLLTALFLGTLACIGIRFILVEDPHFPSGDGFKHYGVAFVAQAIIYRFVLKHADTRPIGIIQACWISFVLVAHRFSIILATFSREQ